MMALALLHSIIICTLFCDHCYCVASITLYICVLENILLLRQYFANFSLGQYFMNFPLRQHFASFYAT